MTELGYVSRRYPLTGTRPAARSVRFALEDPLLRFWFRFVFPHLSFIARMGPERAFAELIHRHPEATPLPPRVRGHALEELYG
ncbi:MAG: hypothetical protein AB1505_18950 [Candidatus Latescibacterota bacterium]